MQGYDTLMALLTEMNERLKRLEERTEERESVGCVVHMQAQPDVQEHGRKIADYIARQFRMTAGRRLCDG